MRQEQVRTLNRILILIAIAFLLGGLLLAHWNEVRLYASLL